MPGIIKNKSHGFVNVMLKSDILLSVKSFLSPAKSVPKI